MVLEKRGNCCLSSRRCASTTRQRDKRLVFGVSLNIEEPHKTITTDLDFYWLGRVPCRSFKLVGTIVGIADYEARRVYTSKRRVRLVSIILLIQFFQLTMELLLLSAYIDLYHPRHLRKSALWWRNIRACPHHFRHLCLLSGFLCQLLEYPRASAKLSN